VVALLERIVSDAEGAALAARLGDPQVVEDDEFALADRLLAEIERAGATLAVVGCHGYSRPVGIARGAPATTVLHEAPCSVLVARPASDPETWPRTIVAGADGTPESEQAVEVARELAERLGARLYLITAAHTDPVTVLAEESEAADLIVVGHRGLTGVRSLGSVSERVAHEARCPVLVVKG
jgi:nucleotide-binding universal stress UspA family protein